MVSKLIKNYIRKVFKELKRYYYTRKALVGVDKYDSKPVINGKCIFNNLTVGKNCHFNGMIVSGSGKTIIGDNFHSGKECQIITENHNIHGSALPYDDTYVVGDVTVGNNVWLGNRVILLPGINIGEGCVIQAGSVVVCDLPPLSIAGGHPARVFKTRDEDHYNNLKNKGAFH